MNHTKNPLKIEDINKIKAKKKLRLNRCFYNKILCSYFFSGSFNFLLISIEMADLENLILPAIVSITQDESLSFSSKILPCNPLLVITLSPFFISDANFFSSLEWVLL